MVICNGILHNGHLQPEKALEQLHAKSMAGVFEANVIVPAFVAQRLITLLEEVAPDGELAFLDWDGKTVPW